MKTKRALHILLAAALLLGVLCAPAMAKVVSADDDFYYLDDANVLSEALEGEIFFSNELLYDACGAQIVVVTVDTTGSEAIDDYAYDLFNSWGIGDSKKQNGFLLLLAIRDDNYYALTGTGLSSKFSSGMVKTYNDDYLEPDFAKGDYEAGVKKYFEAVFKRVAETYDASVTTEMGVSAYQEYASKTREAEGFGGTSAPVNYNYGYGREETPGNASALIALIVILIIVLLVVNTRRRSRIRTRNAFVNVPPPPPTPRHFFGTGFGVGYGSTYRPSQRTPTNVRSSGFTSGSSGYSGGSRNTGFSGGSRSSGFGSSSRSSGFGSSSRSSFGGSSHSSGFGSARGGGGGSRGGGAGRGRH